MIKLAAHLVFSGMKLPVVTHATMNTGKLMGSWGKQHWEFTLVVGLRGLLKRLEHPSLHFLFSSLHTRLLQQTPAKTVSPTLSNLSANRSNT